MFWAEQGKGTNISEIITKFRAQNIVTGGLGLLFSAFFARSLSTADSKVVWFLYSTLTTLHLFANVRCIRQVHFNDFNIERMHIVAQSYLNAMQFDSVPPFSQLNKLPIMNPKKVSKQEHLLPFAYSSFNKLYPIRFGCSLHELVEKTRLSVEDLRIQLHRKYIIKLCFTKRKKIEILVSLGSNGTNNDHLKALFHANILKRFLCLSCEGKKNDIQFDIIEEHSNKLVDYLWESFQKKVNEAGWDLEKSEIQNVGYLFCS